MRCWLVTAMAGLAAVASAGPLDTAWIKGETDKDPFSYRCGEEMTLKLTPMEGGGELKPGEYFLDWDRSGEDGVFEKGREPFDGKTPFVYRTKTAQPGFVRLRAYVVDAAGKRYQKVYTGDTSTPEGRAAANRFERTNRGVFFDGGAGASVKEIKTYETPVDLAEYWHGLDERLAKVPMEVVRKEVLTLSDGCKVYAVSIMCAGAFPVTGYLTMPKGGGRYPARLETHGYSGSVPIHRPNGNDHHLWRVNTCGEEIVLNINPFGMLLPAFGGTDADQKAHWWAVHDGRKWSHGFSPDQNADRDAAFFNGMVLRVKRALQYLKSLPEWDGQNLIASGGSQGGLQTIWAAACGEGVTRAESGITWCCDMSKNTLRSEGKISTDNWYIPWTPALAYYDPVQVAKLIPKTCKTIITRAGLGDYCCPPNGLFQLWTNIPNNKEIHWMQGSTHGYVPPQYPGRDYVWTAE